MTSFTLNDGLQVPAIGLGCWMGQPGGEQRVYNMCTNALKIGYRHLDTASSYENEVQVGRALKDSGIPRSEVYITTKLGNPDHHRVREAAETSLRKLDCSYLDLYLMHWPQALDPETDRCLQPEDSPTFVETWKEMELLLDTGLVRSIGVSNFSTKNLELLLSNCRVVPAMNQVEMHPFLPQNDLKKYCGEKGILLTAYSPLGRSSSELLADSIVTSIAAEHGVSVGQVLLSWGVQRGTVVVPKSEAEARLISNFQTFQLSPTEMGDINSLHRQPGKHKSLLAYHGADGVFGWTYEQLGWNMTSRGVVVS